MAKRDSLSTITISKTNFSYLRIQDGIRPFFEKPSDEYINEDHKMETFEKRMTAIDLFSHFTANIIKEKVIFIR